MQVTLRSISSDALPLRNSAPHFVRTYDQGVSMADSINYQLAKFVASYGKVSQIPESTCPEVSFVGRSNVGKSSIMNKLFGRKNLVKVSSTPGKTSNITAKEMINLKYYAEIIKNNPNQVYRVTGYADKATGTPAYNQKLSEKRAQNVADALVKKFGVKASQLQVVGKGGVDNLYEGGVQLSRVVIVE